MNPLKIQALIDRQIAAQLDFTKEYYKANNLERKHACLRNFKNQNDEMRREYEALHKKLLKRQNETI